MCTVLSAAAFEFVRIVAFVNAAGFVAWATCLFAASGVDGAGNCCGKTGNGLSEAGEG